MTQIDHRQLPWRKKERSKNMGLVIALMVVSLVASSALFQLSKAKGAGPVAKCTYEDYINYLAIDIGKYAPQDFNPRYEAPVRKPVTTE